MLDAVHKRARCSAKPEWPTRDPEGKSAEGGVMTDFVAACDLAEPAHTGGRAFFHFYAALTEHHGETGSPLDRAFQLLKICALWITKERFLCMTPA